MIYSTKQTDDLAKTGVITYARTFNDFDVLTWQNESGEIITQSQKRILQAMSCPRNTMAVQPLEKHHEIVADTVKKVQEESSITNIGGMLGNRFSTRYRIICLLEDYYKQPKDLFYTVEQKEDLKLAIDEIYNFQLTESSKQALGKMMHRNHNNDEIVEYVNENLLKKYRINLSEINGKEPEEVIEFIYSIFWVSFINFCLVKCQ